MSHFTQFTFPEAPEALWTKAKHSQPFIFADGKYLASFREG
jgi:hypothetical protein